jgi:hypothetical protein
MEGEKTQHICDGGLSAGVLKLVNTLNSLIEVFRNLAHRIHKAYFSN